MIVGLKALHIAALVLWCAGLVVLPGLFAHTARSHGDEARRLARFARTLYTHVTSPAAFVAVASGTALVFAREVFTVWFALKLGAVGLLVLIHVRHGFVMARIFGPGRAYANWRVWLATGSTVAVIGAILVLVLAKPPVGVDGLPDWMHQPGGLQSFSDTMMPMP